MSTNLLKRLKRHAFPRPRWEVGHPRKELVDGACRISACVAGHDVWYESAWADLAPAVESFLAPFLMPALLGGALLTTHLPVDAVWHEGMLSLLPIWRRWWGFEGRSPLLTGGCHGEKAPGSASEALFFTAGVDSFHALMCGPRTDYLVYVQGFDVPLGDRSRMEHCSESIEAIGRALDRQCIFIRTNLREHPLIASFDWEKLHGSALAAVGYLLGNLACLCRISSSDTGTYNVPWGTHQDLDARFSTSTIRFEHWGASVHRADKVRTIAEVPLAQEHLRVCWEHRIPTGNCSRCEKCLRTMFQLSAAGHLEDFRVFDSSGEWWRRLGDLQSVQKAPARVYWEDLLTRSLPSLQRGSIEAFLLR